MSVRGSIVRIDEHAGAEERRILALCPYESRWRWRTGRRSETRKGREFEQIGVRVGWL